MEALAFVIIKTIVSCFVKYYVTTLLAGSTLVYNSADLGYKVPKWYMNPGRATSSLYAYGTSIEGDEFQSLDKARDAALKQMAATIRMGNKKMVVDKVSYNQKSIKQRRLVDLFVKGNGLEDFIRTNVSMDKKQLVKTRDGDMRAFVRLSLKTKTFMEYQKKQVKILKSKIVHQKSDDILAEMDAEIAAMDKEKGSVDVDLQNSAHQQDTPEPQVADDIDSEKNSGSENLLPPDKFQPPPLQKHSDKFDDLEKELDQTGE